MQTIKTKGKKPNQIKGFNMIDIFIIVGGTLFLMLTFLYLHFAYCKYKSPFLNNGDFKEYLTSFYNTIVKGE